MGEIDKCVKAFIRVDTVFAQLFSEGVFQGRLMIDPDKLKELDTVNQSAVRLENGQFKYLERLRDAQKIAKLFDERMAFQVIMGVEEQTGVNYCMPVRCMELDALAYSYQCKRISEKAKENKKLNKYAEGIPKGTKIVPTVTLVFYVGSKLWNGPTSIYDMLDIPEDMKKWAKEFIPDYEMHIIDAKHMTEEEINKFDGDLKAFLLMIQERFDEDKLKTVVATHKETWYAIGAIKKDKRYAEYIENISDEELAGGVYMDAVLDRIEARGKAEGKAKINQLALLLAKEGRIDEFIRSAEDKDYQKQLLKEYGLEDE